MHRPWVVWALALAASGAIATGGLSAATDVVLYSSDFANIRGNWATVAVNGAAGGAALTSTDYGWSTTASALAAPADYVEATFSAPSNTLYHVWIRQRAANDSKYNDSTWAQFSDALDSSAQPVYPIGSTSGLLVNLENCSGCALSGWGWQDKAYWLQQTNVIQFASSGTHTIRIQTREDGVQIDQVVLSPAAFLTSAPGAVMNDSTIVPRSSAVTSTPYGSAAAAIPGQINAESFDNGGEGIAYHDTTSGNSGGQVRSTDVDIEASSEGGYDVGWIAAGEWLNYTIAVPSSGSYSVQFRVASPAGSSIHVGFNGVPGVWSAVSIPATGGWQNWTTVTVPLTLGAGTQIMTLMFDTGGMNLRYAKFTTAGGAPPVPPGSGPYSGVPVVLPGRVEAENFDNGGEGVAYHDASPGNSGGAYRNTDVDIEASAEGGYDVGWTSAGEWLNYTVAVASAGNYTVGLRVAAPSGAAMHVGFNGASSVSTSVAIPSTGGWQAWTTVNVPMTLGAGVQKLTLQFDTGGVNVNYVNVALAAAPPPSGTTLSVATWNIQINDGSDTHARVAMDTLLAIGPRPDVIVIQEAYQSLFGTYIDELQRQTGQAWHGAFATHCQPGSWNGSSCTTTWYQGIGIFTTYNIVDSSSTLFPFADCWTSARAGLRAGVNVNGTVVQVFTTHLQTGGCTNDAQSRYNSMAQLKSWAAAYSRPQIVAGDFNADPDQIDTLSGMLPAFVDTWSVVGSGRGFTAFSSSPTMKIDYWFSDAGGRAQPQSSQVFYGASGVSDHLPVQTTFVIR